MSMEFLDTNPIIRYITQDTPAQAQRAYAFFQQVGTGALIVTTSEGVIVETVQVLSSKKLYNQPRQDVRKHLTAILILKGLKLPHKRTYLRALDIFVTTNIDFVDALNVAHMERLGLTTIVSFDKHYNRVPGVSRRDP